MIRTRTVALVLALVVVALGIGFLVGYPSQVAAATAIALAVTASVITTRELAGRAGARARPVRRAGDPLPLEQLRQVDRALKAARSSGYGVDRELLPLLRPIAGMRLARREVDLDRHPEEAREILGEQLAGLLETDRLRGSNRVAGGIPPGELDTLIERLERI